MKDILSLLIELTQALLSGYYWAGVVVAFLLIFIILDLVKYVGFKDLKPYHLLFLLLAFSSWVIIAICVALAVISLIWLLIKIIIPDFKEMFGFK